jgi:hypothetical protein
MKLDFYIQFQALSFCGPSVKFVIKFNIHALLCDNEKQFTRSASRGDLINPELLHSPVAVMTLTQKPATAG